VLLISGDDERFICPQVHKVDLATGECTPLPSLLSLCRPGCTAARLPDGRVVCVGKNDGNVAGITAEVMEELPDQGSLTSAVGWRWRELPGMSVARIGCGGCVLSDGRFAIFGGMTTNDASTNTTACEIEPGWRRKVGATDANERSAVWLRVCVVVAGGNVGGTVEVYEEALGRWRRLPCSFPHDAGVGWMGSALMRYDDDPTMTKRLTRTLSFFHE
jgi:hypothetical protein